MTNQVQQYNPAQSAFMPDTQLPSGINAGSVSVEQQRAIAEAQGQIAIAKRFPRNLTMAHTELMESCSQLFMAEIAFYSVPRGTGTISGPSIRLAEEIARCYGNFEYGHKELSRDHEKSEVEVYAWDKEKNNFSRRQITVFHTRDVGGQQKKLTSQKDIDDKIANVASKQVRSRILALLPKWLTQAAEVKCRETLTSGPKDTMRDRIMRMVGTFGKYGVTVKHLETIIGHSMDDITPDEIADLQGIFNAVKEGEKISTFFPDQEETNGATLTQQAITQSQEQSQKQQQTNEPAPDLTPKTNTQRKPRQQTAAKPEAAAVAEQKQESKPEPKAEPQQVEQKLESQIQTKDPDPQPEPQAEPELTPEQRMDAANAELSDVAANEQQQTNEDFF